MPGGYAEFRHLSGHVLKWLGAASAAIFASSILTGCASVGPRHVVRDRFDYAAALSRSWKENILLNLVKLRYADAPLFLDVSSIVEQYTLQGQLSAAAQFPNPSANPSSVGGNVQWADRPTISYQPLTGSQFTKSLLTPIKPVEIMDLVQAGWPVGVVFRFGVQSINDIHAGTTTRLIDQTEDPRFASLVDALSRLQQRGAIGLREETKGGEERAYVMLPRTADKQAQEDRHFVAETLGIDPALSEYRLAFGAISGSKDEIAVLTRTVFEILFELSFGVEVPPEHEADGRVGPPLPAGVRKPTGLRVVCGTDLPGSVFAAVHYESYWFWIDDRDFASKRTLSFMMILLALAQTGGGAAAPALTLPTGP